MKTREQKAKDSYIKHGGVRCPYCGSFQIKTGEPEPSEGGFIFWANTCIKCFNEWDDTFTLTNITLQTPIPELPNSIKFIKSLKRKR